MDPSGTLLLLALMSAPSARLEPCPPTPNCVSTQAEDPEQRMTPIPFRGEAARAQRLLVEMLEKLPRVEITRVDDLAVRAEFTTPLFRFTDDVDFLIDPETGVIHFRSASRVGHHDLGVNRRRMRRLTRLFRQADERGGDTP